MASIAPEKIIAAGPLPSNIPPTFPPHITTLLNSLHADSLSQEHAIDGTHLSSIRSQLSQQDKHDSAKQAMDDLMLDKFIALDQDKCLFIYNTLLAMRASLVVEAGTSFGVSTVYLAMAVGKVAAEKGRVVATEKEESKAAKAREIWKECGGDVEGAIDLRVGDLQETLKGKLGVEGQFVDALLLDSELIHFFHSDVLPLFPTVVKVSVPVLIYSAQSGRTSQSQH